MPTLLWSELAHKLPVNPETTDMVGQEAKGLVLVSASSSWCGPCKRQATELELLKFGMLVKIDVEKDFVMAEQLKIRSLPTVILLDHGVEINRWIGLTGHDEIKSWIELYSVSHEPPAESCPTTSLVPGNDMIPVTA